MKIGEIKSLIDEKQKSSNMLHKQLINLQTKGAVTFLANAVLDGPAIFRGVTEFFDLPAVLSAQLMQAGL